MSVEQLNQQITYETMEGSIPAIRASVLEWEKSHPNKKSVILIAGPAASGKDTLVEKLGFVEDTVHLSLDRYFKDTSEVTSKEGVVNFSNPEALDRERIQKDVAAMLASPEGGKVSVPVYSMKESKRIGEEEITVQQRILIQGVYSLMMLQTKTPFRIFIDVSNEVRLERRLIRDVVERGIPEEVVRERFEKNSKPALEKVLPQRSSSTIIIKNN